MFSKYLGIGTEYSREEVKEYIGEVFAKRSGMIDLAKIFGEEVKAAVNGAAISLETYMNNNLTIRLNIASFHCPINYEINSQ